MVDYRLFINNGVDAFNTTGKTLSIEEQPKTVSVDFLAEGNEDGEWEAHERELNMAPWGCPFFLNNEIVTGCKSNRG